MFFFFSNIIELFIEELNLRNNTEGKFQAYQEM